MDPYQTFLLLELASSIFLSLSLSRSLIPTRILSCSFSFDTTAPFLSPIFHLAHAHQALCLFITTEHYSRVLSF